MPVRWDPSACKTGSRFGGRTRPAFQVALCLEAGCANAAGDPANVGKPSLPAGRLRCRGLLVAGSSATPAGCNANLVLSVQLEAAWFGEDPVIGTSSSLRPHPGARGCRSELVPLVSSPLPTAQSQSRLRVLPSTSPRIPPAPLRQSRHPLAKSSVGAGYDQYYPFPDPGGAHRKGGSLYRDRSNHCRHCCQPDGQHRL